MDNPYRCVYVVSSKPRNISLFFFSSKYLRPNCENYFQTRAVLLKNTIKFSLVHIPDVSIPRLHRVPDQITAMPGQTAILSCLVGNLGNRLVSLTVTSYYSTSICRQLICRLRANVNRNFPYENKRST